MEMLRRDRDDSPLRVFERDGSWYVNRLRGCRFTTQEQACAAVGITPEQLSGDGRYLGATPQRKEAERAALAGKEAEVETYGCFLCDASTRDLAGWFLGLDASGQAHYACANHKAALYNVRAGKEQG